jgi:type I restriction enzyme, R subunit
MAKGVHTEETFESLIEDNLLEHGGYESGSSDAYDRQRALLTDTVLAFVQDSQPKGWSKLEAIHENNLEQLFLDALCKVLDQRGSLDVLRHGFRFHGQQIRLAYFEPGNNLNPDLWDLFGKNRLTVVRQLRYDLNNDNELDLTLFLNGIPIVTAELKNAMTGQKVGHAKRQYKEDRDPKAPIFSWRDGARRALVHFAVDADEVWMTTRLSGVRTYFLPFNKGDDHGKGNPAVEGKHRSHYLWEEVWERRSLLELVGKFVHLKTEEDVDPNTQKKKTKTTLIFPRYHQLDCVRELLAASRDSGAGTNYLVQHSAGSGKSNSIAWLAHRLASLHDANDRKVYDSVVVLTDRTVLDDQLQETIYQFDHKQGVVVKIDKQSDQLAEALQGGDQIIISTIHKFGFIQDKIQALPDRRYAIIVDEAHSSQSGEMAVKVKELLSDSSVSDKWMEEGEELAAPDQLALRAALFRGPQPNMSFFAFTATPKFKTLEMFGHKGEDGKPAPFHLYSMKQAIEEKFILDVLLGYTTYKRFFKLAKEVSEDPELDTRKAASALARFVNLHPTNIAQKTEIIIEHYRSCVMHLLEGKAKAMVVTSSRLQAIRYKQAFDKYLRDQGYGDVRCLVAFSGEVQDDKVPTVTYTETQMNGGIKEKELRTKFASDEFQILIVANKYQTGFDAPLLCAMYVDKRLSGIQAVQTLSRLNRQHRGKETTFVLDFVNKREDILASFQDYYESTTTDDAVDPQRLYELQHELVDYRLWTESEVDGFAALFFKLPADKRVTDHAKLNAWLDPAVDRFKALTKDGEDQEAGEERQKSFRDKLTSFKSLYAFLGQILPFHDPDLEKLYTYGRMLLRKLPRPEGGEHWEPGEDIVLASFRLRKAEEGNLRLQKGTAGELSGPSATGSGMSKPPKEKLSTIIEVLNDRFGLELPDHVEKVLDGVANDLSQSEGIKLAAKANDKANFGHVFSPAFKDALVDHHDENGQFVDLVFRDDQVMRALNTLMMDRIYGRLRVEADGGQPGSETAQTLPFRRVALEEAKPFENCIPALDLKVAAGGFAPGQVVEPGLYEWVALEGRKAEPDLFVAQVVGESMNRRIPNGAWCLWRFNPGGSRQGKVVLAESRGIADPEHGGHYTVKIYESVKEPAEDGGWRHSRITLKPDSTDAAFEPIVLEDLEDGELRIIAELVEVLG